MAKTKPSTQADRQNVMILTMTQSVSHSYTWLVWRLMKLKVVNLNGVDVMDVEKVASSQSARQWGQSEKFSISSVKFLAVQGSHVFQSSPSPCKDERGGFND